MRRADPSSRVRTYQASAATLDERDPRRSTERLRSSRSEKKKDVVHVYAHQARGKQGQKETLDKLEAEVEAEVQDAVKFADESAEPGPELLEATTYTGAFAR